MSSPPGRRRCRCDGGGRADPRPHDRCEPRPRRVEGLVVAEDLHPPLRRVADDLAPAGRDDGRLAHVSSLRTGGSRHACEPLRHCGLDMMPLWCHTGAIMDLTPYVENLRRDLAVAAEAGGEDARALAERLTAPLESAIRLTLLDALSAAADEITRELAPGSVELRLRAGEPDFVVTPAPADEPVEPAPDDAAARAAGRRRGRDGAHQPAAARAAQGRHRAGRQPRAAVRQRLARPRRRRRARARRPPRRGSAAGGSARATPAGCADRARRFAQTHVSNLTHRREPPCRPSTPPNRSRPRSTSPSATSGSARATAPPRSSRCDPATPSNDEDVKAAEQTRVEYANEQLLVKTPKLRSWLSSSAAPRST